MTTTILLIGLGGLVLCLFLGALLMPGPNRSVSERPPAAPLSRQDPDDTRWHSAMDAWERQSSQSLRAREIDEDADALAGEFRRAKHERYLTSLRSEAAEYFASATPATAKKSAT